MGTPPASPLAAAYLQYASLGLRRAALHLDLFEQPDREAIVRQPHSRRALRLCAALGLALLICLAAAWPAEGATLGSCAAIRAYFKSPLPEDPYAREQDLKAGVEVLQRDTPPDSCDDWIIERAYFELANARDELSRTFRDDPRATKYRAGHAARSYEEYLDWFLGLPADREQRLIRILTRTQGAPGETFKAERRKWLRARVGNVLNSMGACFVRAETHGELLAAYDRYFRTSIEIFPNEVARKWHKWLRAMPDFAIDKHDAQIRALIVDDAEARSHWDVFTEFLEAFIQANPSAAREWDPVLRRVRQWLLQVS